MHETDTRDLVKYSGSVTHFRLVVLLLYFALFVASLVEHNQMGGWFFELDVWNCPVK